MIDKEFESVIPTAILTSYPKTLTDIPYSQEVFRELRKNKISDDLMVDKLAPEIEARFKLINKLLRESQIDQVLEIASGYSTRGVTLTKTNNRFSYIEMDLPEVSRKKTEIINSFTTMPDNLHIISGNALNKVDIDKSEQFFTKGSQTAVICEGLLRYLDFDEKRQVAKNIHGLLSKHGGVWITCDVTPKKFISNQNKNLPNFNKKLSGISDRNNSNWRFDNIEHVKDFFGQIGFDIESVHPFSEVKEELVSPSRIGLDNTQVDDLLKDAIVVVMKPKKTPSQKAR